MFSGNEGSHLLSAIRMSPTTAAGEFDTGGGGEEATVSVIKLGLKKKVGLTWVEVNQGKAIVAIGTTEGLVNLYKVNENGGPEGSIKLDLVCCFDGSSGACVREAVKVVEDKSHTPPTITGISFHPTKDQCFVIVADRLFLLEFKTVAAGGGLVKGSRTWGGTTISSAQFQSSSFYGTITFALQANGETFVEVRRMYIENMCLLYSL